MTVVINKSRRSIKQERRLKKCLHFGCEKEFIGLNRNKYCDEHNTRSWRKKRKINNNTDNIVINVDNVNIEEKKMCCSYLFCNKFYSIYTSKDIKLYPKYCEEHRNEYKRKIYYNEKL